MSVDLGLDQPEAPAEPPFEALAPQPPKPAAKERRREPESAHEHGRNGSTSNPELYLISGLMVAPEDMGKAQHLPPEAFDDREAKAIWGAMRSGLKWPLDLFVFEKNTGIAKSRLFEISNLLPTSAQTGHFIETVEEAWRMRRLKKIGAEMTQVHEGDPASWIRRLELVAAKRSDTVPGKPISAF